MSTHFNGEKKMKILITILLALFISSNAIANEGLKNLCESLQYFVVDKYDVYLKEPDQTRADAIKRIFMEDAKLFHYLDCSDFRSESGRIE